MYKIGEIRLFFFVLPPFWEIAPMRNPIQNTENTFIVLSHDLNLLKKKKTQRIIKNKFIINKFSLNKLHKTFFFFFKSPDDGGGERGKVREDCKCQKSVVLKPSSLLLHNSDFDGTFSTSRSSFKRCLPRHWR